MTSIVLRALCRAIIAAANAGAWVAHHTPRRDPNRPGPMDATVADLDRRVRT